MNREKAETLTSHLITAGLLILVLTIPFAPRWGSYSLIFLGLMASINGFYFKNRNPLPFFLYFLIGAYVVRVLWLMSSTDFDFGLRSLETQLPLLIIPILFASLGITQSTKALILNAFVLMAFCVMIFSFIRLSIDIKGSPLSFSEYISRHFETAQYYAQLNMLSWDFAHYSFLSVVIIYGLHIAFYKKEKVTLFWMFFSLYVVVATAFFVFTGSKSGEVLLVVSFLGYGIIRFRKAVQNRISIVLLAGLLMSGLAYLSQLNIKEYVHNADPQRYQFVVVSWERLKEKPLLGFGTGSTKSIMQDIDFAEKIGFSKTVYEGKDVNHPHNQYLSELLQFGIIGSIPLFLFLTTVFIRSYKDQNWELLSVIVTISLFMLVESPLNSNKGVLPFMVLVSLLAQGKQKNTEQLLPSTKF